MSKDKLFTKDTIIEKMGSLIDQFTEIYIQVQRANTKESISKTEKEMSTLVEETRGWVDKYNPRLSKHLILMLTMQAKMQYARVMAKIQIHELEGSLDVLSIQYADLEDDLIEEVLECQAKGLIEDEVGGED